MAFSPETYALLKGQGGGGGGSDLPSVTAADNGKVLSVVSGAWAASNISGLCTDNGEETLDKSYNDIVAMLNVGIHPFLKAPGSYWEEDGDVYMMLSGIVAEEGNYTVKFMAYINEQAQNPWYISSDPDEPLTLD